jgi:hypothetical protein
MGVSCIFIHIYIEIHTRLDQWFIEKKTSEQVLKEAIEKKNKGFYLKFSIWLQTIMLKRMLLKLGLVFIFSSLLFYILKEVK